MNHPLLTSRTFDVALVDEASQISTPAVLAPLLKARSFVLVGDHYQLSPLVTSPEAAAQGYGVSLFRQLSEAHPGAVVALRRCAGLLMPHVPCCGMLCTCLVGRQACVCCLLECRQHE
jgi:DNA replication ATP-dependent helicase Dna2